MNPKDKLSVGFDVSRLKSAIVNFIIPLVCILASLLIGLLLLMPAINNKPLLQVELNKSEKLKLQLQEKKNILNDLVDFRPIVEENASFMNSALVSEASVPELLAQVSMIAQESGFEVTRLAYSYSGSGPVSADAGDTSPSTSVAYQSVTVSLGTRGSYDQLVTFLDSIENAARLVNVENYRYSRDKDGILEANFILSSPFLFVQSSAVTDDGITLDMASTDFVNILGKVKALRVYSVSPEDVSQVLIEETETSESSTSVPESGGNSAFDF